MKHHHVFQVWITFIIFLLCSLLTLIPYEKYRKKYMDFVRDFNNVPQKHYEKQLEIAEKYMDGEEQETKKETKETGPKKEDYKKPYYIRDRKNRYILHKYKRD